MDELGIPRKLSHIWIGPLEPPTQWMATWPKEHPKWTYSIYDNRYLSSKSWINQHLIDEYLKRGKYAGASDLMRLEILYEEGGFIAPADSICLKNMDHLFIKSCPYTVYENEFLRGKLVSPIQASNKGNEFIYKLILELNKIKPEDLDEPWISTGNLFVSQMIEKYQPDIEIFPSKYLIPYHYTGIFTDDLSAVYAVQLFGSTNSSYKETLLFKVRKYLSKRYNKKQMKRVNHKKKVEFMRSIGLDL